jgi:hypothetical protein
MDFSPSFQQTKAFFARFFKDPPQFNGAKAMLPKDDRR